MGCAWALDGVGFTVGGMAGGSLSWAGSRRELVARKVGGGVRESLGWGWIRAVNRLGGGVLGLGLEFRRMKVGIRVRLGKN